ncbi:unnamed protein product [Colias eurytheme]|nr:unnamed protein product [Colias eurytheme]
MDNIDMDLLISLVENRPVLWDKTQVCYKNRLSSFAAWREIFLALNEGFETLSQKEKNIFGKEIIKKWNNARDNWIKCHRKVKQYETGSGAKSVRKYKFYDQMLFLSKIATHRTTKSSFTSEKSITHSHTEETDSQTSDDSDAPDNTTTRIKTSKRKRHSSEVDRENALSLIKSVKDCESKSMCFFKGIAPIVDNYNDDDYLEFQYKVIKVMRKLTRRNQAPMQQHNYYDNNRGYPTTPDFRIHDYQQMQPIPSTSGMSQELLQQDDCKSMIISPESRSQSPVLGLSP